MAEPKNKPRTNPKASGNFDLQDSVHWTENLYRKHTRLINGIGIAIILVISGYFGYRKLYIAPREVKALSMVFKAQQYFDRDSLNLALNGDGNNYGFLAVIRRYGNTQVGQTAKYCAGVIYVRMGHYRKGISYLKQFNAGDKIVQAVDYGLIGDAYMQLGNTKAGIRYYEKAGHYNSNEIVSPLYLMRAGLALEKAGKPKDAMAIYKEIKSKYPESMQGRDIDKYLARLGDFE
ncbi:MAG TPA: tetratricopeptide repeat protein [Chitinophagaceae bacterium]|nr:tetratricopeptide repeat protein [Chitinophagaceae bacterium]